MSELFCKLCSGTGSKNCQGDKCGNQIGLTVVNCYDKCIFDKILGEKEE